MKPFDALTKQGQTRRLRTLALEAIKGYPIKVAKLRLIQNDWNATFRIDTTRGKKYVMRINRAGLGAVSLEILQAELAWVDALNRETTLKMPKPLANKEHSFVTTTKVDGVPEPRHCIIFSWLPGKTVADHLSPDSYFKLGQLSAQLHLHAKKFRPPKPKALWVYDHIFSFGEDNVLFEPAYKKWFPAGRRKMFENVVGCVQAEFDRLYSNRRGVQIIHNDLHHWNVMVHRGQLSPFDFEDLRWGFPVQDVATTLFYVQYDDNFSKLSDSFKQGYETQTKWPERYDGEIYHYMAARRLMFVNHLIQSDDPAYQEALPELIKLMEKRLKDYLKQQS